MLLLENVYFSRYLVPFHVVHTLRNVLWNRFALFFDRCGIGPIFVMDSIRAIWTRILSATKICNNIYPLSLNVVQVIPSYIEWNIYLHNKSSKPPKTTECYLPLITTKVTDSKTIHQYMDYFQCLSSEVNMSFTNVGAEDFHFMKENFKVKIS